MRQNIILWDRAVSYGIEQSNVELNNQKWNRAVSNGTAYSHVGQISLMWERVVSHETEYSYITLNSLKYDRAVSYRKQSLIGGTGQSHIGNKVSLVGQNSLTVSFKKKQSHIRKISLILNVLKTSKYFFAISKRHLDCLKVQSNFSEV